MYSCNVNTEDVDARKDFEFELEASLVYKRCCLKKIENLQAHAIHLIKVYLWSIKKVIFSKENRKY